MTLYEVDEALIGFLLMMVIFRVLVLAVAVICAYLPRWFASVMRSMKALNHTTASSALARTSRPSAAAT